MCKIENENISTDRNLNKVEKELIAIIMPEGYILDWQIAETNEN